MIGFLIVVAGIILGIIGVLVVIGYSDWRKVLGAILIGAGLLGILNPIYLESADEENGKFVLKKDPISGTWTEHGIVVCSDGCINTFKVATAGPFILDDIKTMTGVSISFEMGIRDADIFARTLFGDGAPKGILSSDEVAGLLREKMWPLVPVTDERLREELIAAAQREDTQVFRSLLWNKHGLVPFLNASGLEVKIFFQPRKLELSVSGATTM